MRYYARTVSSIEELMGRLFPENTYKITSGQCACGETQIAKIYAQDFSSVEGEVVFCDSCFFNANNMERLFLPTETAPRPLRKIKNSDEEDLIPLIVLSYDKDYGSRLFIALKIFETGYKGVVVDSENRIINFELLSYEDIKEIVEYLTIANKNEGSFEIHSFNIRSIIAELLEQAEQVLFSFEN